MFDVGFLLCRRKLSTRKLLDRYWRKSVGDLRPTHELGRRAFNSIGLGGLYSVLTSPRGSCVAIRLAFEAHCELVDPDNLGKFATFASACMQLRCCDDWEVKNFILQCFNIFR